ncbi:MAG: hypothetical protein V4661_12295 [Pseudomonadota bacterium]
MTIMFKRIAIVMVLAFVVIVFGLFAYNFYLRSTASDEPPVIYERSGRPSRA